MSLEGPTTIAPDAGGAPIDYERGATSVEYAILVSLIAAVIIGVVAVLGVEVEGLFSNPELNDALTPR